VLARPDSSILAVPLTCSETVVSRTTLKEPGSAIAAMAYGILRRITPWPLFSLDSELFFAGVKLARLFGKGDLKI